MRLGELAVTLSADLAQYNKDLDRAEGIARKRGSTIGDIFQDAFSFTIGMGMFEAIQSGFRAVVSETINFNSMMEQAQIGFTTMLGSAEKAQAFLNRMADFAAKTPFEYPDLLMASRRMMAMGFATADVLPTLRAVGDAAAGLGAGREGIERITYALGQMRTMGRINAQDMMQLTNVGIPAWEILAEAMGKSVAEVRKLSSEGLLPAEEALQQLIDGMDKRFGGMMENMENTWMGVTSTIKDVWRLTLGSLTAELFGSVTRWLQGIRDWATEFYKVFRQFGLQAALATTFGPEFAATVATATAAARIFWNAVKTAASITRSLLQFLMPLRPVVIGALGAFLAFRVVSSIMVAVKTATWGTALALSVLRGESIITTGAFGVLSKALEYYRYQLKLAAMAGIAKIGVLTKLRFALKAMWIFLGPKGWAILAVSAALAGGVAAWGRYAASVQRANQEKALQAMRQQTEGVAAGGEKASEGVDKLAESTEAANKAAGKNIQAFDEVHQIMDDMAAADLGIGDIGLGELPDAADFTLPDMQIEEQKATFAGFMDYLRTEAGKAWDSFKARFAWASALLGGLWGSVKGNWNKFFTWAGGVWDGVKVRWSNFYDGIKTRFSNMWAGVRTRWDSFLAWARRMWDNVTTAWDTFITRVRTWADSVRDAILTRWANARQWGRNLIDNIIDGIESMIDRIRRTVRNVAKIIEDFLGFGSPTKTGPGRYADKWAPNLVKMYAQGITGNIRLVRNAATRMGAELMALNRITPQIMPQSMVAAGTYPTLKHANYQGIELNMTAAIRSVLQELGADREAVINIDGQRIARAIIPAIVREEQRTGVNRAVIRSV